MNTIPAVNQTEDITRKLEEAMRQAHQMPAQLPIPRPPIPQATIPQSPAAPATPSQAPGPQGGAYAASGPEAFEDEIRKLLGRGPHAG
jgi:hypothetical protein